MSDKAKRIGITCIDESICHGCKLCTDSCMMDVIYFNSDKNVAYAKYPEDCQSCFLCVGDCPVDAITISAIE